MKKYRVNVNGTVYDITLEVLEGEAAKAPAPVVAPAPAAATAAAPAAGGQSIDAPMPGNIISVNVKPKSPVFACDTISAVPGVLSATRICFAVLCATRPILVSATPRFAMMGASLRHKSRMTEITFSRSSKVIARTAL